MHTPLAIPRRYIWVAAGAAAAGAFMFLRNRFAKDDHDEFYESRRETPKPAKTEPSADKRDEPAKTEAKAPEGTTAEKPAEPAPSGDKPADKSEGPGGTRELAEFLSGDSWYDESGWRSIWEREGVEDSTAWLRNEGKAVLEKERKVLSDHPALLAGCRRRWIVVCRYAGIDVSDAATLWNETDS